MLFEGAMEDAIITAAEVKDHENRGVSLKGGLVLITIIVNHNYLEIIGIVYINAITTLNIDEIQKKLVQEPQGAIMIFLLHLKRMKHSLKVSSGLKKLVFSAPLPEGIPGNKVMSMYLWNSNMTETLLIILWNCFPSTSNN